MLLTLSLHVHALSQMNFQNDFSCNTPVSDHRHDDDYYHDDDENHHRHGNNYYNNGNYHIDGLDCTTTCRAMATPRTAEVRSTVLPPLSRAHGVCRAYERRPISV